MLLETKGLKLFHNVKTRWIFMLSLTKQVLTKYIILVVKMYDDLHITVIVKTNSKIYVTLKW
jgi:hypothetical protein